MVAARLAALAVAASAVAASRLGATAPAYDLVVYGATPAGIATAIAFVNESATNTALLVHPLGHVGGIVASGLGWTDTGNTAAIGGWAATFFDTVACGSAPPCYHFEPHAAEDAFLQLLRAAGPRLTVQTGLTLVSASAAGGALASITVTPTALAEAVADPRSLPAASLTTITGRYFADASYEGDLLAAAGVPYAVGREGKAQYGETLAGVVEEPTPNGGHQFKIAVPYTWPNGTVLPMIYTGPHGAPGDADADVQAYNFRMCLTTNTSDLVPFSAPAGYDPAYWELVRRYLLLANITSVGALANFSPVSKTKTDVNNNGPISTDFIGGSWAWPTATPAQRKAIWQAHKDYTQGFFYFLQTDAALPAKLREDAARWGLSASEFTDNGNWPWQLYVREGRRMVGDYVFKQSDREFNISKPDSIGLFSYNIDTHNAVRYIDNRTGTPRVLNDGDIEKFGGPLGQMPYRVMLPPRGAASNLIVPVALSASHIGYGCLRLEPQFMILGQSAGVALAQALAAGGQAVQDVDVPALQARLRALGQRIDL